MMTVWQAIIWAWKHNYAHIYFLDAGLPYPNNPFREFILRFGGKPVAKYRWLDSLLDGSTNCSPGYGKSRKVAVRLAIRDEDGRLSRLTSVLYLQDFTSLKKKHAG